MASHVCKSSITNNLCTIINPCAFCAIDQNIFVPDRYGQEKCRFCNYQNKAEQQITGIYRRIRWCNMCQPKAYAYLAKCGTASTMNFPRKEHGYIVYCNNEILTTDAIITYSILMFLSETHIRVATLGSNYEELWSNELNVTYFNETNYLDYVNARIDMLSCFVESRTKAFLRKPLNLDHGDILHDDANNDHLSQRIQKWLYDVKEATSTKSHKNEQLLCNFFDCSIDINHYINIDINHSINIDIS
jgi:hypothetical protein